LFTLLYVPYRCRLPLGLTAATLLPLLGIRASDDKGVRGVAQHGGH